MKEIGKCKDCRWLRRQQSATEKGDFCLMGVCNSAPDFINGDDKTPLSIEDGEITLAAVKAATRYWREKDAKGS